MNKSEIETIVNIELQNNPGFLDMHGITKDNISLYIISPYQKSFFNPISNITDKYWVVFDENQKNEKTGYLIFYSEKDECFGLGTKTTLQNLLGVGGFVGLYGSFVDTVNSM